LRAAAKKKFPVDAQQAVMASYDCCAKINKEDNSTLHKHRLSTRHFKNVPAQFQDIQPTHVCPAFLAMHSLCKNAK